VYDAVPLSQADGDNAAFEAADNNLALTWNALLSGCDVFGMLVSILTGLLDDDVLLEAVSLARVLAGHASLAQQLADSGVVSGASRFKSLVAVVNLAMFIDLMLLPMYIASILPHPQHTTCFKLPILATLMAEKCRDDEFVLQVMLTQRLPGTRGRLSCMCALSSDKRQCNCSRTASLSC
jgi:hypothetical protein